MNPYRKNAHAVIIGINHYQDDKIPNLNFARADAEGLYNILIDPELGRISPDNVILLVDEQATQRNIRSAIGNKIARRADENDMVCIYYAGHGAPVINPKSRSNDGMEKYLVPSDAELDDLRATGISMDDIQRFFGWIESRQLLFFIDSCYSGQAGGRTFDHPLYQKRASLLTDEFLDEIASEGRVVITACDVNELSLETPGMGHGLFTYYLIEGLKGKADMDKDGLVTIHELYEFLTENVKRHALELGGSMHPIIKGSIKGKIFLSQYETEAQKQAKRFHVKAQSHYDAKQYKEAYTLWQKVIQLVPDHDQAKQGLSDIIRKFEEARKKQQQILKRKQTILYQLYRKRELPADEYNQCLDLITKSPKQLSQLECEIRKLVDDLTDKKISAENYLQSINLLRENTIVEDEEDKPTPEPIIHQKKHIKQGKKEKVIPKSESKKITKPERKKNLRIKLNYKLYVPIIMALISIIIVVLIVTKKLKQKEEDKTDTSTLTEQQSDEDEVLRLLGITKPTSEEPKVQESQANEDQIKNEISELEKKLSEKDSQVSQLRSDIAQKDEKIKAIEKKNSHVKSSQSKPLEDNKNKPSDVQSEVKKTVVPKKEDLKTSSDKKEGKSELGNINVLFRPIWGLIGEWQAGNTIWMFYSGGTFCKKSLIRKQYTIMDDMWLISCGKYSEKPNQVTLLWDNGGKDVYHLEFIFPLSIEKHRIKLNYRIYDQPFSTLFLNDISLSKSVIGNWRLPSIKYEGEESFRKKEDSYVNLKLKADNEKFAKFRLHIGTLRVFMSDDSYEQYGYYYIEDRHLIMINEQTRKRKSYNINWISDKYMTLDGDTWIRRQ